jgi:hypothetical protein
VSILLLAVRRTRLPEIDNAVKIRRKQIGEQAAVVVGAAVAVRAATSSDTIDQVASLRHLDDRCPD